MSLRKKHNIKAKEKILVVVRRYAPTLFWAWVAAVLFIVTPFYFMFHLFRLELVGYIIFGGAIVIGLCILGRTMYLWRTTRLIVTSRKIIFAERRGIFQYHVTEIPFDQVSDVIGSIKGIMGTMFRYGTLSIQTASGHLSVDVSHIKKPALIQTVINDIREHYLTGNKDIPVSDVIAQLKAMSTTDLLKLRKAIGKRLEARKK